MNYVIRRRQRADCYDIAHVVTVAWQETYRGIVADDFLDNLSVNEKERGKKAFDKFNEADNHQFVLEVDGKIVGFVNVGSSDEKDYNHCGEIHAVYIIGGYKGYGFGKKLIEAGINELKSMNYDKMIIGCLAGNKSNDFYKHIGGVFVKTRTFNLPDQQLPENVYYFDKI